MSVEKRYSLPWSTSGETYLGVPILVFALSFFSFTGICNIPTYYIGMSDSEHFFFILVWKFCQNATHAIFSFPQWKVVPTNLLHCSFIAAASEKKHKLQSKSIFDVGSLQSIPLAEIICSLCCNIYHPIFGASAKSWVLFLPESQCKLSRIE